MLYSDKIDISEGVDVNKTSESKYCDIFHQWYINDINHCIISGISKSEAVNLLKKVALNKKSGTLKL